MASSGAIDGAVHHALVQGFLDLGIARTVAELGEVLSRSQDEVRASLERLAAQHGTLLDPGSGEPWITHPFSSTPTLFHIAAAGAPEDAPGWWAPCIWCALGVVALAGDRELVIRTRLGGDGEACEIHCGPDGMAPAGLVAHFPVPPARAWENVHRHCACTLVFEGVDQVDRWCTRHRIERGEVLTLEHTARFAADWYGRHLSPDWRKPTLAEARAVFERAGLTSSHWRLPDGDAPFGARV